MKLLKLDTVLLFALLIPFIMTYRISPGVTPYWLFGTIFLGLFANVLLDVQIFHMQLITFNRLKNFLVWFLIIASIGSAFFSSIVVRHITAPVYEVHDIILQQESAVQFLLHGKNPYAATYFGTPLEKWHYSDTEINPAIYHFVMQPFYLVFAVPFYLSLGHTIGFFDARVPLFLLFFAILIAAFRLLRGLEYQRVFLVLLAFNPATLGYLLEGRDDMFMFAFLSLGLILLYKKRLSWSGLVLGLAFATKQSVWPLFPFYFAFLYFKNRNLKKTMLQLIPFVATFLVIVAPFFLWNPRAFIDSTILYLSGSTAHSYPVAGYGLGMILYQLGFIKDVHAYYPFWIFQIILGIPLLVILIMWMKKENSMQRLLISYGLFLFVFWYTSRYFNNSHLGYLSVIFLTAYFWPT